MNKALHAGSQGFLSFLLAAVFLFALLSAASSFSSQKPSLQYEQLQAVHIQDIAMKNVFYSSIAGAAASALASSQASGSEPQNAVQFAVWHKAQDVQAGLIGAGYDTAMFCGQPSDSAMQDASARMRESHSAALPAGAIQITSISCVHAFGVDLMERKIHISGAGFCAYSSQLGMGFCGIFPPSFEVDF